MYTVYGWAPRTPTYRITFYDMDSADELVLETAYTEAMYSYDVPEDQRGMLVVYPQYTQPGHADVGGRPFVFPVNDPASMATLRWQARASLNDTEVIDGVDVVYPTNPKWTDTELNTYIREVIGMFNIYTPPHERVNLTLAGARSWTPLVGQTVLAVYMEDAESLVSIPRTSVRSRNRNRTKSVTWDLVGDTLKVFGGSRYSDETPIQVLVSGQYTVPLHDFDIVTIPRTDWDIVSLYVQGKATLRLATQSAQLDRWKEQGSRDDNPIFPIAKRLMNDAEERLRRRAWSASRQALRRYEA